jgi:hypothetical protein
LAIVAAPAPSVQAAGQTLALIADRDDDDADGVADAEQALLPMAARADLVPVDHALVGQEVRALRGGDRVRIVAGGRPLAWGKRVPAGAMWQGLLPGLAQIALGATTIAIEVRGVAVRDGAGEWVDLARDHASLARTPPNRVEGPADARYDDPDALRVAVALPDGAPAASPPQISAETVSAAGAHIDTIAPLPMSQSACPPAFAGVKCVASAPLRFVIDEVDRSHPLVAMRSLRAEVGGALVVRDGGKKLQALRILGPRRTPAGPIARLKATIRPFVLRIAPGGAPAIGGTEAGAVAALRAELSLASSIWGQCGLTFGPAGAIDVKLVNPPPPYLVAIGDDAGLPATGGELRLRAEGHAIALGIPRGSSPDRVADELARAAERAGLTAAVSPNARIAPGASGSVDVLFKKKDGQLATVEPLGPGIPLSTDATLVVRIGTVDLSDGLQHFGDMDSVAGTIEERSLLKSIDDGDPQTVEVVVVPFFAGGGRIGESFIASDLSSLRNVVLLDRAGVRARRSSLTLAHELGHVLMDMPGHPDDYGVDTPTQLMDSDASDASPFGPRRLTVEECARVVRQAGPKARVPLLQEWRIAPLVYEHGK